VENKNIKWLFRKLDLLDAPKVMAYEILKSRIKEGIISISFDKKTFGVSSSEGYEAIYDDEGDITRVMLNGANEQLHTSNQKIISFYAYKVNGGYKLSVGEYEHNDEYFYPSDETGMWFESFIIDEDDLYLTKENVIRVENKYDEKQNNKLPPNAHTGSKGTIKALALLAREKADSSDAYKNGTKVNASRFKDHIITLAKNYFIGDEPQKQKAYLLKIDDVINAALKEYDLRDL
jgi:hypothetical protein